jgi:hypothetical protein
MPNAEPRMTKEIRNPKSDFSRRPVKLGPVALRVREVFRDSIFGIHSTFVIRHSSFTLERSREVVGF